MYWKLLMMKKRWQVRSSPFSSSHLARRIGELFFRICTRGLGTICKYPTRMVGRRCRNGPMRTCSLVKPSSNHTRTGDEVEPVLDLPSLHACDQRCCQPNLDQQESTRTFIERVTKNDLDVYSSRMTTTSRAFTRTPITLISWRLFFRRMQTIQPWHVCRVQQVGAWRSFTRRCTLNSFSFASRWLPAAGLWVSPARLPSISRRCRKRNWREDSVSQRTSLEQGLRDDAHI